MAGVKCSNPNDIRLRNPKTASIEGCIVCPECAPSQQYSIQCGSTVDIGNVGHCEDCPRRNIFRQVWQKAMSKLYNMYKQGV